MKFENKHFLIVIERKKKVETADAEKKEKTGERKWIPYAAGGAALLAIISIVCGLHFVNKPALEEKEQEVTVATEEKESILEEGAQVEELPEGTYVTATHLASTVREKYQDKTPYGYTYGEPIKGIKRDEIIEISVGFDVSAMEIEYWTEFVALYQDPELQYMVTPKWSYDAEAEKVFLEPTSYPIGIIFTNNLTAEQVTKYEHSDDKLFPKDTGTDWGNLGTMYMAFYIDPMSGEKLETPMVQVVTLEGEIEENPTVVFSILEDGRAAFTWNEIEGAEEYFICSIDKRTEQGLDTIAVPIGVTTDTSWCVESPDYDIYSNTNYDFKNFDMAEEDWYDEYSSEYAQEKYGITEGTYLDTTFKEDKLFCVIAVNQDGTSMMSNTISLTEIAPNLPYKMAYETSRANGFERKYESVDQISPYGYVTMCDGYTATKLIDYGTDKAKVLMEHFIETDDEGNFIQGIDIPVLQIPCIIEGTPFEYVVEIQDYDEVNLEKDLAFLDQREEKLRKKSGDVGITNTVELEGAQGHFDDKEIAKLQVREVQDTQVTANSALSEYLAMNMLGGASLIDLSEFPEADDPAFVDDAWREAYYQNPLILGAKGYRMNKTGTAMRVVYDEDAVTTAAKQAEIQNVISSIIASIITEDMTELEKELAINQYLCDNIVYDEDALANAEKNDFKYVDDEFIDSFTAYGALINGKCVCAGYAAAFKLLAQEAGLEAVVVTGFLEGSLSHAWNKVKIDGEWQILDVTNNDNEYLFNALLNLPDYAGDRVLVEDKDYVLDKALDKYDSVQENNEYYRISERYFPYKEVTNKLVEELTSNGKTVLRTDYELNDDMFGQITNGIFEQMGNDIDLYGFYWMGVIYLSLSE